MFFTDLHNHLWIITDAVLIGTKHSVQTVHNPIFLAYNEFIEANIQVNTAKDVYIYIYSRLSYSLERNWLLLCTIKLKHFSIGKYVASTRHC